MNIEEGEQREMNFRSLVRLLETCGCAGICNFGIGSPREMPPLLAILRYMLALCNPWGHGYAPRQGRMNTLKAVVKNCLDTLGVAIQTPQVMLLEGSKPAIRYVLEALGLKGKVVMPLPFYPGHMGGVKRAGCKVHHIGMPTIDAFITSLRAQLEGGLRPVAVILSFDNPRWLPRTTDHYRQLIKLAQQYNFLLISDEAYRGLGFEGGEVSIMQVDGWAEEAVCLQTGSKPFSMAGFKIAVLVTKSERIPLILERKCEDSEGGSPAAQKAYAVALRWCQGYPRRLAKKYFRRAMFTVNLLKTVPGIAEIEIPAGGMFIYFRIRDFDSMQFWTALRELGFEVSPGKRFGEPDRIRWCLNHGYRVTYHAARAVSGLYACSQGQAVVGLEAVSVSQEA